MKKVGVPVPALANRRQRLFAYSAMPVALHLFLDARASWNRHGASSTKPPFSLRLRSARAGTRSGGQWPCGEGPKDEL